MDDLGAKLSQILNSPDGMNQLRSVAASLGLTGEGGGGNNGSNNGGGGGFGGSNNNTTNNGGTGTGGNMPDMSAISALLSGLGSAQNGAGQVAQAVNQGASAMPNIDINMIMKVQQAMSQLSTSDKNVELLLALKPHFGDERRKKVDDAIKIMQMIKLLPLIKESGLFGGGLL